MHRRGLLTASLAATAMLTGGAGDPDWPARPITLVVPFTAGGPTDVLARTLAEPMSRALGQPVTVENITGAGGTVGAAHVAQARPDGYNLLLGNIGVATSAALYRNLPYDPATAFETIGLVSPVPMVLVARPDLPARSLSELLAWARGRGAAVNFAHAGVGSASHLCATLLRVETGIPMTAIAFRGTAPAMKELMAGRIDLTCDQTTSALPYVRDGRVKAIVATTSARLPVLPQVPTAAESGLPALEVTIWHGLYAPRGTPAPVVERLSLALKAALRDERVVARLADLATTPEPQERATPAAHRALLEAEMARWRAVLQGAGGLVE
ncbi:tripartite tricarboxylate transporter substrate-binding protein [Paracraurococcus lichenis]|uniref:Tripartite tricarboxylate transporter substrate-binding protein n=1 Tax=Paracraurococcus lichenis TaxID=3064888 RepID=A0ABT9E6I7_9PROT|nr:tripartite tricarboxylate transporter substrate-binding protein [Paracraurococcus sp. LOR1-02]MDO9711787.1 tripartite tricarboxylate transporter substrate-binding protein [Paracraurococcus sp. LOR1-02]